MWDPACLLPPHAPIRAPAYWNKIRPGPTPLKSGGEMIRLEKKDSRRMKWEHGWEHGEGAGKPDPRKPPIFIVLWFILCTAEIRTFLKYMANHHA